MKGSSAPDAAPRLLRSGDRCQCPTCEEFFNSSKAFDQHRTGWFAGFMRAPSMRRCLSSTEMAARGMKRGAYGWLTRRGKR